MISVGTSGFSYKDWKGPFYPTKIKPGDMLDYYAQHFSVVEINYTYYRMPEVKNMDNMASRTSDNFNFCIKANNIFTHELPSSGSELKRASDQFIEGIKPVTERERLGCILLQFPWGYKKSPEAFDYLKKLREVFSQLPVVVEFRNSQWADEYVYEFLRLLSFGFCCVDEPKIKGLMPSVALSTSDIAYFRFHGRNAKKWYKHEKPHERYEYLYCEDELGEWVDKIKDIASQVRKTFVMFNNHYRAFAVQNGKNMIDLLFT